MTTSGPGVQVLLSFKYLTSPRRGMCRPLLFLSRISSTSTISPIAAISKRTPTTRAFATWHSPKKATQGPGRYGRLLKVFGCDALGMGATSADKHLWRNPFFQIIDRANRSKSTMYVLMCRGYRVPHSVSTRRLLLTCCFLGRDLV